MVVVRAHDQYRFVAVNLSTGSGQGYLDDGDGSWHANDIIWSNSQRRQNCTPVKNETESLDPMDGGETAVCASTRSIIDLFGEEGGTRRRYKYRRLRHQYYIIQV